MRVAQVAPRPFDPTGLGISGPSTSSTDLNSEGLLPNVHSKLRRIGFHSIAGLLFDFPSRSRHLVSTHRRRRKELDRQVSDASRRGLDLTNFFMADVQGRPRHVSRLLSR